MNSINAPFSSESRREELLKAVLSTLYARDELKNTAADKEGGLTSQIVSGLLSHADDTFFENNSTAHIEYIAEHGVLAALSFLKTPKCEVVHHENITRGTAWWIVIEDRPFIINTITETFSSLGATITTLLHPIISHKTLPLSLCVVETEPLSATLTTQIEKELHVALSHLRTVTDDFSPMLMCCESVAHDAAQGADEDAREISEFLHLLSDGGFVFLGYARWDTPPASKDSIPSVTLGLCKEEHAPLMTEITSDHRTTDAPLTISRMRSKSDVHRRIRMVGILLKSIGAPKADHFFTGIFTSKLRTLQSSHIPLIRRKLSKLLSSAGALPNSHPYKSLVNFIDNMPKEDALRLDLAALSDAARKTLGIYGRQHTKVAILNDLACKAATIVVAMPRDRFTAEMRRKLQRHVERAFGAESGSSEYTLDVSDKAIARFYFSVSTTREALDKIQKDHLSKELASLTRSWVERFEEALQLDPRVNTRGELAARYKNALGEEYQALHSVDEAIDDIVELEALAIESPIRIGFSLSLPHITVVLYSLAQEITLSKALPVLEFAGFEVISERAVQCEHPTLGKVSIYRFLTKSKHPLALDLHHLRTNLAPGLCSVFEGKNANDPLNQLLLLTTLSVQALSLLRTYVGHLSQINKFATRHAIFHALVACPQCASLLWQIFEIKFNPATGHSLDERGRRATKLLEEYTYLLAAVKDISQDRILRGLGTLVRHTVRTNFYSHPATIALKVHSEAADIIPHPRPKYEIYVSGPLVEGIHLRSSTVSRGGIRWSDRRDDYRTEVLGLMKTQKIKNSVIVPSGAKGGFFVKQPGEDAASIRAAGEQAYSAYIRALLSITDNIKEGKTVHPPQIIMHDGDDPYFVVAADKGTASFSDVANKIAIEEFGFWLGDAFASGGSNGYDHKKYGITARGAWECVKRHFNEIGIDYEHTPFTVIGIGDMSGDVFGNGLILSNQMKLIAAFDHRSLFIDPSPDPLRSWQERKRLFELKGSAWKDYDPALISKGGGVWNRTEKEIVITPEIRQALFLNEEAPQAMSGEQLIWYILRAPVDLLWNGGIGTYVKASNESHADVNDSSNDAVRVNAEELRVRVVAEGGNLGFTQEARREFAALGGKINTDAIDNSGGVDLSDHEVNLKILLARATQDGRLKESERKTLLKEMAEDIVQSVLRHNHDQALALSLGERRSKKNIFYFKTYLRDLNKLGYINRVQDRLPDDEELDDRAQRRIGLYRPELANILSAAKIQAKDALLASDIPDDPALKEVLFGYFPEKIAAEYRSDIPLHALARNITASELANLLVDTFGLTFFHRMAHHHMLSLAGVMRCAIAAEIALDMRATYDQIVQFEKADTNELFLQLNLDITRVLRAAASWLMSMHREEYSVQAMVQWYAPALKQIYETPQASLAQEDMHLFTTTFNHGREKGLPEQVARRFAIFPLMIPILETLAVSQSAKMPVPVVSAVYSEILSTLSLRPFVTLITTTESTNRWENEVRVTSYEEIRRGISKVALELLSRGIIAPKEVKGVLLQSPSHQILSGTLRELENQRPSAAALAVVAKQVCSFSVGQ